MADGGNFWSGWSAYLSFFRHVSQLPIDYSKWQHYEAAAIHAGPRFMHKRFCVVSDRPEFIHRDAQARPHRIDGPYIRWQPVGVGSQVLPGKSPETPVADR